MALTGVDKERRTLADHVAERLRQLIVSGELPPGMPLRLHETGARLGVSVTPVREALRQLEAARLVTFAAHRGAAVAELSGEEIEELYAVRAALEGLAARYAALRMDEASGREMRECLRGMEDAAGSRDFRRFVEADVAFHRTCYKVADRPGLLSRIVELSDSSRRAYALAYGPWRPALGLGVGAHQAILAAVEAGDGDSAELLTTEHLREGGRRILAALREQDEERPGWAPIRDSASSAPKRRPASTLPAVGASRTRT